MKEVQVITEIAGVISKLDIEITPEEFIKKLSKISDVLFRD